MRGTVHTLDPFDTFKGVMRAPGAPDEDTESGHTTGQATVVDTVEAGR